MGLPTPHKHLGCTIRFDELIPEGVIEMRSSTWATLHEATAKVASSFEGTLEEARANTDIDATSVGPISGPDAHTGPLVAVGSLEAPAVLVPNMDDSRPNQRTIGMTPENTQHLVAAEPLEQPYPTDPTPPEPTDNTENEHVTTHTVLPEHPEYTAPPETPEAEWLRHERDDRPAA